ncbi:MAG TPA: ABC transporter permease [Thermoplasmata archaeon]|jgi:ABC-type dipeptide/oligopeptide/nickel transport system permease component|nr:ABC transporter permease [Thermoplasmata archaeon]
MGRSLGDLGIFVGKRLLQLIPVLVGIIVLAFIFTHLSVVNPCAIWYPHAGKTTYDNCLAQFRQPIYVQFFQYFGNLLVGNWGASQSGVLVFPTILQALPATVELVLAALFLMVFIGIPLGVVAAQSSGRWADHLVRIFYLSGWATPTYLGAVIAAIFVAPYVGLPSGGYYSTLVPPFHQWTHFSLIDPLLAGKLAWEGDALAHLALPAAVLAFINMGIATRMTRSSMLEVIPLDYVKAARMKGLSEFAVMYKHALRNSLITTTTVLGVTAGGLLSGTVVVEEVFTWPGIGAYAYDAITQPNFDGAIAIVAVFAIGVVLANLIADILYGLLDPRVDWR